MLEEKLYLNADGTFTGNCGSCGKPMTTETESLANGGFHDDCDPDSDKNDD